MDKNKLLKAIYDRINELDYTEEKTAEELNENELLLFVHDLLSRDDIENAHVPLADMVYAVITGRGSVDIRDVLRHAIGRAGLTQKQIAEACNIRVATLGDYLNKKTDSMQAYETVLNYVIKQNR